MTVRISISRLFGHRPATPERPSDIATPEPANPFLRIGVVPAPDSSSLAYMRNFSGDIYREAGFHNGDYGLLSTANGERGIVPVRILESPSKTTEVYRSSDGTYRRVHIVAVAMPDSIPPQNPPWFIANSRIENFQQLVEMGAVRPILRAYPITDDFPGALRAAGAVDPTEAIVSLRYRPGTNEDMAAALQKASDKYPPEMRRFLDGIPLQMPLQ
ncbi:MAG: hypothetical protein HY365_02710 [Candidatus Aenigmarchaeota archaeon]|nr:hypothetical protein [Candidatus Aenigmarchaeota archaeon]